MSLLSQEASDELRSLVKVLIDSGPISFPSLQEQTQIRLEDKDTGKTKFTIDVQRRTLNIKKATYQTRAEGFILLRLDIEGPPHTNPDHTEIPCPHLHIYHEGYNDGWAFPLEGHIITDTHDIVQALIDFLEYNHVENIPRISVQGGGLI